MYHNKIHDNYTVFQDYREESPSKIQVSARAAAFVVVLN